MGRFDVERNRLLIPRQEGYLQSVNFRKKQSDTFPFPYDNFSPESLEIDSNRGHLYLYGFRNYDWSSSIVSRNYSRVLLVFDLERQTFLPVIYRFPRDTYDFDTLEDPELQIITGKYLAVKHPKRLEIYRIKN